MECNDDGQKARLPSAIGRRKVGRKRRAGDAGQLQLAFATSVPYSFPTNSMHVNQASNYARNYSTKIKLPDQNLPFMNNMDEISYWVYTKRAPCLLNYDNLVKKTEERAHCSKAEPVSILSEKPSPKKKRKLNVLDDESISSEKKQNVFFETSQQQNNKTVKKSCRSKSLCSNIDFNIKDSDQIKPKLQKKAKATKASKVITSTPKVTNLRRSLRKKQQSDNNNSHLNNSHDVLNASAINGDPSLIEIKSGDGQGYGLKKSNNVTVNGQAQFEDDSDVSGFTANYIRSTKIQSSKATPKSRSKNGKVPSKGQKHFTADKDQFVVCVNKSVNTDIPKTVLNCSTDSSQNIINLVTVKNNKIQNKVDKSTSLLKFVDTKDSEKCVSDKKINKSRKNNLNVSFESKSSGVSRYPKRNNNITLLNSDEDCNKNKKLKLNSCKKTSKRQSNKAISHLEDTVESSRSRTRSGKKIGLNVDLEMSGHATDILQINSVAEPLSSSVALNVAACTETSKKRLRSYSRNTHKSLNKQVTRRDSESEMSDKKFNGETSDSRGKHSTPSGRLRKSSCKTGQSLQRDSLRDKSGFAACFSDSDSDNEPLLQRKFFC